MNRWRITALALALSGFLLAALPSLAAARLAYFTGATQDTAEPYAAPLELSSGALGVAHSFSGEGEPPDVAISPDGSTAYVLDRFGGGVLPIEVATNAVLPEIPLSGDPIAIAISPDGNTAYVADRLGAVDRIALSNGSVTEIPVGGELLGIAVSPDGATAYVSDNAANSVIPIALATNLPGTPIEVGEGPEGIAIAPNGSTAYVVNRVSETVSRIDLASRSVTGTIPVGIQPQQIAVTPDGSKALVVGGSNPAVGIALGSGQAKTIEVAAQHFLEDVAVLPDGSRAYVTDNTANEVVPINIGTEAAEAGLASYYRPSAIAIVPNQPPHASFTASPSAAKTGQSVAFDGSGSTDSDGTVARYDWEFGDGSSAANGGAKPSHSYAKAGTYTVTLTTTDNEGCSTALVFTGQTAYCNGSSVARTTRQVTVGADCAAVKGSASSFVPKFRSSHVVPGVRVRLATSAPARLDVTATLLWSKDGGGSAGLGKVSAVVKHWRRIRFPIPADLRDELPLGTPVRVKLTIASHPLEDGCAGAVTHRTLKVKVVKVIEGAVQFMHAF